MKQKRSAAEPPGGGADGPAAGAAGDDLIVSSDCSEWLDEAIEAILAGDCFESAQKLRDILARVADFCAADAGAPAPRNKRARAAVPAAKQTGAGCLSAVMERLPGLTVRDRLGQEFSRGVWRTTLELWPLTWACSKFPASWPMLDRGCAGGDGVNYDAALELLQRLCSHHLACSEDTTPSAEGGSTAMSKYGGSKAIPNFVTALFALQSGQPGAGPTATAALQRCAFYDANFGPAKFCLGLCLRRQGAHQAAADVFLSSAACTRATEQQDHLMMTGAASQ